MDSFNFGNELEEAKTIAKEEALTRIVSAVSALEIGPAELLYAAFDRAEIEKFLAGQRDGRSFDPFFGH